MRSVEVLQLDMPAPVGDPAAGATAVEVERWKMAYKRHAEQTEAYQNFLAAGNGQAFDPRHVSQRPGAH